MEHKMFDINHHFKNTGKRQNKMSLSLRKELNAVVECKAN